MTTPVKAPVPVICVGNLTVGGTGKTPVAIAIAERITALGLKPGFLTRAYGAQIKGPMTVDPALDDATTVSDDTSKDTLTGDGGSDWFLFNRDNDGVVKDKVTDLSTFEALFALDIDWLNNG